MAGRGLWQPGDPLLLPRSAIEATVIDFQQTTKRYYNDRCVPLTAAEAEAVLRLLNTLDVWKASQFFRWIFGNPSRWMNTPGLTQGFRNQFRAGSSPGQPRLRIPHEVFQVLAVQFQCQAASLITY
jgi:hypothetical protein